MHLIDSHCHLDFTLFDLDRDLILSHCEQLGVKDIIVPAVTRSTWQQLLTVCEQYQQLYPALGLHPMFMAQHQPEDVQALQDLLKQQSVIAIGEIGLDFYMADHDKQAQTDLFIEQLKLAQSFELPVLLHVRKAHDQVIACLKKYPVSGGIVHAFNGSIQQAEQYQKLGFLFGVGGAITHHKATRLRALISQLPLSSLVLETDAPDMPLSGQQDQRNTPENISLIAQSISKVRQLPLHEIANITTENCKRVFKL